MNIKPKLLCTLLAGSLLSLTATANDSSFKLAVIENSLMSEDVVSGQYAKAIASVAGNSDIMKSFEESTSLCVAYIKSGNSAEAESACTAAVENISKIKSKTSKVRYLEAISYSNRGVAKYFNEDLSGAMNDLTSAILIDDNSMVKTNLMLVKNQYSAIEETYTTMTAE